MNKFEHDKNYAKFLFLKDQNCEHSSYLSEFIAFIKSQKITSPFIFSYVGDETNLLPALTLSENILMNFSPQSLTTDKENQFEEFLNHKKNYYIKKLFDKLVERDVLASFATPEMRKLAALIKALSADSEYIFLENPELDLSENIRILFTKALDTYLEQNQINAFIYSSTPELWKSNCSHTVNRNKYFQFQIESITVNKTKKKTAA
jgi:ABC-type multidrug transport system ATPase subunit